MLDPVEEAFDVVALFMKSLRETVALLAVGLIGNVRCRTLGLDPLPDPINIVGFVAEQNATIRQVGQQHTRAVGGMLMNAHHGTVDHLGVTVVSFGNSVHDAVPDACLAPAVEAIVAGRVRAITLRQIAPRRAQAQHPEDAIQHASVVNTRNATRLIGKKRVNHGSFKVRKVTASTHVQVPTV